MGKKNTYTSSLGRSLVKNRFGHSNGRKFVGDKSMLHTTEIQDGYDWGRLNLQSVTEESSFQEFLSTAELAGTEFQAEKLNIKFVNPRVNVGLLSKEEKDEAKAGFERNKDLITIPRRPAWNSQTTSDELEQNERESFLNWRRALATLQEEQGILLTPYEKNLEFWRQLWRVIERSDVVVQIVDARNPLLFRCEDLEKYVKEVSDDKLNLILVNKADFLTETQRVHWADYFSSIGVRIAFFSAVLATAESKTLEVVNEEHLSLEGVKEEVAKLDLALNEVTKQLDVILDKVNDLVKEKLSDSVTIDLLLKTGTDNIKNSSELLTREKLIEFFRNIHTGTKVTSGVTTIGLVGYPNVGKSSTINALMTVKKVSVSATPGKTKHFQTLYLDKDILLCDCPGLVMPSFVFTKAEMVVNGILPIDQMRDHVPPTNLISNLLPRHVIEDKYGIMLPKPMEGEDEDRPPTSEELLNAYGYNRGFMTANGQPDNPRSARYILKDFMNGKLLYAHAPPMVQQNVYHTWPEDKKIVNVNKAVPPREVRAIKPHRVTTEDLDKVFFRNNGTGVHVKGKPAITSSTNSLNDIEKPWRKNKNEKKKKEKLRRTYAHLDQH